MKIKTSIFTCALIAFFAMGVTAKAPPQEELKPTKMQSKTIANVVAQLNARHYRDLAFDDALSERFLNKYIDNLDPGRMFFYQKDIAIFKKDAKNYDDFFKSGKLDAGFEIYKTYQKRVISRLQTVIATLEDKDTAFDFTKDDAMVIDRSEMPFAKTMTEADNLWYKRIKLALLNFTLTDKSLEEARETVTKRYKNQLNRVKQQSSADAFEVMVNALTLLFDPHTNYWSPRTSENFNINMSLSLEGIGAVLQSEDEFTKVVSLVPGGPAAKQGDLKPADKIVAVGQGKKGELVDVTSWRLDEVVDKIRGAKNTIVRLEVLPKNEVNGVTKVIEIRRDEVQLEDQAAKYGVITVPDGDDVKKIGVIHLPAFYINFDQANKLNPNYRSSTRDVAKLLEKLMAENVDGVILDLRNNGGGSLKEATMLTDLFIDQGTVVQIRTPDGYIDRRNHARHRALYRGPLTVLVNRFSASASEIFAGAIQDYQRGLIIGVQTFGKGTVQSVTPTIEGTLKLTESKFYRVSGDSTQHRGVVPDIAFPTVVDLTEVGESAYDDALPWDRIAAVKHPKYIDIPSFIEPLDFRHQTRIKNDPDFIFVKDQIALLAENKNKTTVSLNEKVRLQEKQQVEQRSVDIENRRRVGKGMKPYKNYEAFKEEAETEEEAEKAKVSTSTKGLDKIDKLDEDAEVLETGHILVDYIAMLKSAIAKHNATQAPPLTNNEK